MAVALTDDQVRQTGLAALESKLGAVDALRFLALLRQKPFDYQSWREKTFEGMSVGELFQRFEQASGGSAQAAG
jgi:hypothetical protein